MPPLPVTKDLRPCIPFDLCNYTAFKNMKKSQNQDVFSNFSQPKNFFSSPFRSFQQSELKDFPTLLYTFTHFQQQFHKPTLYQALRYRKIPRISPGAYIFQRPFLRGLFWRGQYSEGLMYGGKFAFQIRLGWLAVGRKLAIFTLLYFVFEGKFQVQASRGAYIWRGLYMQGPIFGILR